MPCGWHWTWSPKEQSSKFATLTNFSICTCIVFCHSTKENAIWRFLSNAGLMFRHSNFNIQEWCFHFWENVMKLDLHEPKRTKDDNVRAWDREQTVENSFALIQGCSCKEYLCKYQTEHTPGAVCVCHRVEDDADKPWSLSHVLASPYIWVRSTLPPQPDEWVRVQILAVDVKNFFQLWVGFWTWDAWLCLFFCDLSYEFPVFGFLWPTCSLPIKFRARSHRTREHICMQIFTQILWCCLQPVRVSESNSHPRVKSSE